MEEQESKRPLENNEQAPLEQGGENDVGASANDANLTWLDGSLLPTPVEELPTLHWPESDAADKPESDTPPGAQEKPKASSGPLRDIDDAMAWLEEMARGRSEPIDEMPTLVTSFQQGEEESAKRDLPPAPDSAARPEVDSDPMAWLEQLAVGQVSPLEELPSVADRLLASEIVSQMDDGQELSARRVYSAVHGPEQVEEALSYLEQLAAAQGVRWSNVPLDLSMPVGSLEEALAVIDRIAVLSASSATVEVPSRPETAVPSAEQPTRIHVEPEPPQPKEASTPVKPAGAAASPRPIPENKGVDLDEVEEAWDDLSARMPEDPQEALEWLTTVAEEELSSGFIVIEEDTLPPLIAEQAPQAVPEQAPQANADANNSVDFALDEMPDDPDEAMAWMRRFAASQPQPSRARTVEAEPDEEWSEPELGPYAVDPAPAAPLTEPEVPPPLIHPLLSARKALRKGDVGTIVVLYGALVERSDDTAVLIPDLEQALAEAGPDPRLIRVLGDAYAKNGQLEKALETYRQGFDQL